MIRRLTNTTQHITACCIVGVWFVAFLAFLALGGCGLMATTEFTPSTSDAQVTRKTIEPSATTTSTFDIQITPSIPSDPSSTWSPSHETMDEEPAVDRPLGPDRGAPFRRPPAQPRP